MEAVQTLRQYAPLRDAGGLPQKHSRKAPEYYSDERSDSQNISTLHGMICKRGNDDIRASQCRDQCRAVSSCNSPLRALPLLVPPAFLNGND